VLLKEWSQKKKLAAKKRDQLRCVFSKTVMFDQNKMGEKKN